MKNNDEVKKELLEGIIKILEEHNNYCEEPDKIDICFITSIISQQITNCNDLFIDLKNNNYSIDYIQDPSGYTNGQIEIILPSAIYYIKVCEKYYEELGEFATMYVSKQINTDEGFYEWNNDIMNYDEYQKQFNKLHKDIAKQQKEKERNEVKQQIAELQEHLKQLEE